PTLFTPSLHDALPISTVSLAAPESGKQPLASRAAIIASIRAIRHGTCFKWLRGCDTLCRVSGLAPPPGALQEFHVYRSLDRRHRHYSVYLRHPGRDPLPAWPDGAEPPGHADLRHSRPALPCLCPVAPDGDTLRRAHGHFHRGLADWRHRCCG